MPHISIKVGKHLAPTDVDAQLHRQHIRNVVGMFYEMLAADVFGAERWKGGEVHCAKRHEIADPTCAAELHSLIPDLVIRRESAYLETKANNSESPLKVYLHQVSRYERIRRGSTAPIYRPRVYYAFFLHRLQRIGKKIKTIRRLIPALARNTRLAVMVDFDVILAFDRWTRIVEYGDPELSRQHYPPHYYLRPSKIVRLAQEPRACLEEMELPQRRFHTKRFVYGTHHDQLDLFDQTFVGKTAVAPFPVTVIRRKRNPRPPYTGPVDDTWYREAALPQEEFFEQRGESLTPHNGEKDPEWMPF